MDGLLIAICGIAIVWAGVAAALMRSAKDKADPAHEPHDPAGQVVKLSAPARKPSYEPPVTHEDMQRIRIAAESACAGNISTGTKTRNPHPMGSRRYVAWQTYYLEAEATAEWWRARFPADGNR